MISLGKKYMVFKPKEKRDKNGDRLVCFSIGNSSYNKIDQTWEQKGFINVVAKTEQTIQDRDKVAFSEITGLETNEYQGKQSVSIFVKLEGETEVDYGKVSEEDLPF